MASKARGTRKQKESYLKDEPVTDKADANRPLQQKAPCPKKKAIVSEKKEPTTSQVKSARIRNQELFLKTGMCKFHLLGMCSKGSACPYAHDASELNSAPDLFRTRMCKSLLDTGRCTDTSCKYAHNREELRTTPQPLKTKLCKWWPLGQCALGQLCSFKHDGAELTQNQVEQRRFNAKVEQTSAPVDGGFAERRASQADFKSSASSVYDASPTMGLQGLAMPQMLSESSSSNCLALRNDAETGLQRVAMPQMLSESSSSNGLPLLNDAETGAASQMPQLPPSIDLLSTSGEPYHIPSSDGTSMSDTMPDSDPRQDEAELQKSLHYGREEESDMRARAQPMISEKLLQDYFLQMPKPPRKDLLSLGVESPRVMGIETKTDKPSVAGTREAGDAPGSEASGERIRKIKHQQAWQAFRTFVKKTKTQDLEQKSMQSMPSRTPMHAVDAGGSSSRLDSAFLQIHREGLETPSEAEETLKKGLLEISTCIQGLQDKSKELTSDLNVLEQEKEFLQDRLNQEEERHKERIFLLEQKHHERVDLLKDRLIYVQERDKERRFLLEEMHHALESLFCATMMTSDCSLRQPGAGSSRQHQQADASSSSASSSSGCTALTAAALAACRFGQQQL